MKNECRFVLCQFVAKNEEIEHYVNTKSRHGSLIKIFGITLQHFFFSYCFFLCTKRNDLLLLIYDPNPMLAIYHLHAPYVRPTTKWCMQKKVGRALTQLSFHHRLYFQHHTGCVIENEEEMRHFRWHTLYVRRPAVDPVWPRSGSRTIKDFVKLTFLRIMFLYGHFLLSSWQQEFNYINISRMQKKRKKH